VRLADYLDKGASLGAGAPCLTTGGQSRSYADVQELSRRIAAALAARGVRPGDRVAIWSPNTAEWVMAALGAMGLALLGSITLARLLAKPGRADRSGWPVRPVVLDVRWRLAGPPGIDSYRAGHIPGAQKNPTAPNLQLAHRRLQRRWVRHWVQEPPVIQPGTKMPAFLSGLSGNSPTFDLHGQPWSEALGRPKEEVEFFNNRYGKTADEQANLVLDYLYVAGTRGVASVQIPLDQLPHPPSATTQPAAVTSAPATAPSAVPATAPATAPTTAPSQ
jgi:hypothetical protein